jgi:hypothetical protein
MTATIRTAIPILSLVCASLVSTSAFAKTNAAPRLTFDQPLRLHLAEVEVVNTAPPAAAPAAPAAQPAAAAPAVTPVVNAPVVETPKREVGRHHDSNYMGTIAVSALMGALAGGLIGGSLYFLADDQTHVQRIGYWAAGGVLVGAGVGLVQIATQEGQPESTAFRSKLPSDPAPTFRLALLSHQF